LCLASPVIAALKDLSPEAVDWSKTSVFFTGERNIYYPILRPLFSTGSGLPPFAVKEAAAAYEALLRNHPSIDNSGKMPSFDLLLLGAGEDGHCGSLHPESDQVKAEGTVISICLSAQESKNQIAVSMDVMCAAKCLGTRFHAERGVRLFMLHRKAIVLARGAKQKDTVRRALSGVHGLYDCPVGLVKDLIDNRAAYRALCFSTPGLSEHISGVILHWETLMQEDADGKAMVDIIRGNGMIPGIKVDKGYNKKGMWGTPVGPLGHPEVATVGLDDLQQRCAQAYKEGARFAKWRNVLQLDPEKGLPTALAIKDTVHTLARYASICQSEGLVPIVEPEIVPNGDHDIYYCAEVTEKVLAAQFRALAAHHVYLEGAVLKPNMVKN
ncbi:unnamed protein product, partial [Durusdinium trenchii]